MKYLPSPQRGLTLIELMVALAIFAVLGVLSYRGLAEVATSRTHLEAGFERWRAIGRSMQRIDTDLQQVVSPAASATGLPSEGSALAAPGMILGRTASGGPELQFLRLDDARGVRRVGFRLVDGRLEWLRWSGREALGQPSVDPLLDGVRGMRWRFLLDNVRTDAWPPADRRSLLPDAIILELDLADVGTLTRLIALR
ncbi:type II secretion system minor pseudopilin GspJ [Zoogloea sp.]|jgi:general secretion pathway protein J|uniref:type II secretion system minor pseudopilin GspJ n=1 Tax=Zoogloea sp. TaxID=49181 RepID=UPI001B431C75|nr:type II secretion system minor pseudopilin GspJ [Zoogloea sp.]MBK6652750.1 type II secretion system minor pseudopilin GspJ [Zoogloea sp.]MBP7446090.1 type II secretion system minor pseudopilin GspJ [Zoogloea sp.]HOY01547.1 type II secretion system minor pseudopilin GspJ [Zoogloea sp.]HPI58876.1 type II secretion system minor pseudopilin GspJ [Zoogloea sp.]